MINAMSLLDTNAVLNRLLVLHLRSLPMYVSQATPWVQPGGEAAWEAVQSIAADHQATADRLGAMILAAEGVPAYGEFPLRYTALNDLALDYLLVRIVDYQRQLIQRISECADLLRMHPELQPGVLESLGEAKAHLQLLEEVL
jgi:bacterioferritin (cytochrome b1)